MKRIVICILLSLAIFALNQPMEANAMQVLYLNKQQNFKPNETLPFPEFDIDYSGPGKSDQIIFRVVPRDTTSLNRATRLENKAFNVTWEFHIRPGSYGKEFVVDGKKYYLRGNSETSLTIYDETAFREYLMQTYQTSFSKEEVRTIIKTQYGFDITEPAATPSSGTAYPLYNYLLSFDGRQPILFPDFKIKFIGNERIQESAKEYEFTIIPVKQNTKFTETKSAGGDRDFATEKAINLKWSFEAEPQIYSKEFNIENQKLYLVIDSKTKSRLAVYDVVGHEKYLIAEYKKIPLEHADLKKWFKQTIAKKYNLSDAELDGNNP